MELRGKTFDINNSHKKVINTDDDFAYFEDGARIKKSILVTKYEEVMDPNEFFKTNTTGLEQLAESITKIDTTSITNTTNTTNVNTIEQPVTKIINDNVNDAIVEEKVTRIDNTGLKPETSQSENFFAKIKRKHTINIDFSIEEKFPDLEFVKMMNDNYETSIIEHFAREIVEKMIFDPEKLLESIKSSITKIVYGDEIIDEEGDEEEIEVEGTFHEEKEEDSNG